MKRHYSLSSPILPVGAVNLIFGRFDSWKEGELTCILVQQQNPVALRSLERVIVTSSSDTAAVAARYPVGSKLALKHGQSLAELGTWTVLGVYPHTPVGHCSIAAKINRTSVSFATFK